MVSYTLRCKVLTVFQMFVDRATTPRYRVRLRQLVAVARVDTPAPRAASLLGRDARGRVFVRPSWWSSHAADVYVRHRCNPDGGRPQRNGCATSTRAIRIKHAGQVCAAYA